MREIEIVCIREKENQKEVVHVCGERERERESMQTKRYRVCLYPRKTDRQTDGRSVPVYVCIGISIYGLSAIVWITVWRVATWHIIGIKYYNITRSLSVHRNLSNKTLTLQTLIGQVYMIAPAQLEYLLFYVCMYLFVYLSICLCISLFVCLSVYPSIYLSVYLSVCLPIYLSICRSVYRFLFVWFIYLFDLFTHLFIYYLLIYSELGYFWLLHREAMWGWSLPM